MVLGISELAMQPTIWANISVKQRGFEVSARTAALEASFMPVGKLGSGITS
jgi:hypothetical protein